MNDWVVKKNIEHYEKLLKTSLDNDQRETINTFLKDERHRLEIIKEGHNKGYLVSRFMNIDEIV